MRKAQKNPRGWLTKQAEKMIHDLHIRAWWGNFTIRAEDLNCLKPETIKVKFGTAIVRKLYLESPATLGEIAIQGLSKIQKIKGKTSMRDVSSVNLDYYMHNGKEIVIEVAAATIIARIYDLLMKEEDDHDHAMEFGV